MKTFEYEAKILDCDTNDFKSFFGIINSENYKTAVEELTYFYGDDLISLSLELFFNNENKILEIDKEILNSLKNKK